MLKIFPNLEAGKIQSSLEANECKARSGMCPSSLLAVICFLQVLAFSFCSASAGHPLSLDGNAETRTMFLERRTRTRVHAVASCWERWETSAAVVFSAGSVVLAIRYRWLTSEVRAHSPHLCGRRNRQQFRSDQRNFLFGAPVVGAKCLSLNRKGCYTNTSDCFYQRPSAAQPRCSHRHGDGMQCLKGAR